MIRELLDRVSLRLQYAVAAGLLILVVSAVLVALSYRTLRRELLVAIDRRLYMAAVLAGRVPPGDEKFYDGLQGPGSISPEQYDRLIVAENNRLCRELGLQYLWSCMLVGRDIVFTTSTSPSHDVTKQDHAKFWEAHRDPHAFDVVFGEDRIDYSSFENEWGHGRMVLVPRRDARGREYCLGASVGVNDVIALLNQLLRNGLMIAGSVLVVGVSLVIFISTGLSQPVEELSDAAESIAGGDLEREVAIRGSSELCSLSESIGRMNQSIREKIEALEHYREHLEDLVEQRTGELKRSNEDLEQFAYAASHDLQEPLRKVIGFGELLAKDGGAQLDEKGRDYLSRMVDAAGRMVQLIDALLVYSRVTTRAKP
jgi:signal transduction histidine kinase